MRVLLVSSGPAAPLPERAGITFKGVFLGDLRGAEPSGFARKLRRYLPPPRIVRAISEAIETFKPDVVHITTGRTTALPVVLALRGTKAPVIFEHGAINGLNVLSPFDWLTYFNRRIDRLVVPSHALVNNWTGRAVLRRCIGAGRCAVLPHAVECFDPVDDAGRAALRARYGFAPDDIVVGSVCTIRPIKNLAFTAEVVRRLGPPFVFAVAGDGRKSDMARLKEAGGERLKLLGRINDARRMMAAFDIYATPTRVPGESFGLAPAEAMAAGVPVVTMNFGGTAEIIEHGISGYTLPDDPVAWADRLRALADPKRRAAMGVAARKRVAERFSQDVIAGELEAIYRSLVAPQ